MAPARGGLSASHPFIDRHEVMVIRIRLYYACLTFSPRVSNPVWSPFTFVPIRAPALSTSSASNSYVPLLLYPTLFSSSLLCSRRFFGLHESVYLLRLVKRVSTRARSDDVRSEKLTS